ncbi:hypothetical protein GBA52_001009 [Prunus armeniaca]|nr:hypothetical protein GBA52_001009 [Prunus armeniaca]
MSTLLKFYRPLFSIPYSTRTVQLGTHRFHSLFKPKRRIRCVSTSSHSQPSIGVGGKWESPEFSELWLQNTISRKKEVFRPKTEGKVGIYLRHLGYQVTYVRNFTDVDDKSKGVGRGSNQFEQTILQGVQSRYGLSSLPASFLRNHECPNHMPQIL